MAFLPQWLTLNSRHCSFVGDWYNTYMLIVKQLTLTTHIYIYIYFFFWASLARYTSPTLSISVVGMCSGLPWCDTLLDWKMIDLFSKHVKCRISRSASGSTEWLPQSLCRGANSKWIFCMPFDILIDIGEGSATRWSVWLNHAKRGLPRDFTQQILLIFLCIFTVCLCLIIPYTLCG